MDLPVTLDVLETWLKQQQQQKKAPKSNGQRGQQTAELARALFSIPISEVSQEVYTDGELSLSYGNCLREDI